MRIFKKKTNYDFLGKKNFFFALSSAVILLALVSMATRGMNFGVDFAGGTEIQIGFKDDVDPADIRTTLEKMGFEQASVQVFGPPRERQFLVRMERVALLSAEEGAKAKAALEKAFPGEVKNFAFDPNAGDKIEVSLAKPADPEAIKKAFAEGGVIVADVKAEDEAGAYTVHTADLSRKISDGLKEKFGADKVEVNRVEYVGAAVGKSLRNDAIKSMLYAILMIVIYVGLRFDFRFAPGAIVSLLHDALFTAGFYSWSGLEFNLTTVAAILTIIGYSINDTIVIYDRIRENMHGDRTVPLHAVVNRSVNETMSRTILTSGVTALSLLGLLALGVGVIQDFAVAMLVGMVSGTYSTIYIAAPLTIFLEEWKERRGRNGARPTARATVVEPKQATR